MYFSLFFSLILRILRCLSYFSGIPKIGFSTSILLPNRTSFMRNLISSSVIISLPSVTVMLLLFCELFEKKGALDFQDILSLNLLSGGHQSTLFCYSTRAYIALISKDRFFFRYRFHNFDYNIIAWFSFVSINSAWFDLFLFQWGIFIRAYMLNNVNIFGRRYQLLLHVF